MSTGAKIGVAVCVGATVGGAVALYIMVSPEVATFALVALIVLVVLILVGYCAFKGLPGLVGNVEKIVAATKRLASNYANPPGRDLRVKDGHIDQKDVTEVDLLIGNKVDSNLRGMCEHLLWCAHLAGDVYTLDAKKEKHLSPLYRKNNQPDGWEVELFAGDKGDHRTVFAIYFKMDNVRNVLTGLVIVVRGTETAEDVAQDAQAKQVNMAGENNVFNKDKVKSTIWGPISEIPEEFKKVQCHKGFHDRTISLISQLKQTKHYSKISADTRVLCVGHSLGGAVATLTGMSIAHAQHTLRSKGVAMVTVVTFGAPRVLMDRATPENEENDHENDNAYQQMQDFCNWFKHKLVIFRVQNQFDPVPTVPPLRYGPDRARHITEFFIMMSSVKETALSFDDEAFIEDRNLDEKDEKDFYYRQSDDKDLIKIEIRGRDTDNGSYWAIETNKSMQAILERLSFLVHAETHKMSSYIDRLRILVEEIDKYKGDAGRASTSWRIAPSLLSREYKAQTAYAKLFELNFDAFQTSLVRDSDSSVVNSSSAFPTVSLEQAPAEKPEKYHRFTKF